MKNVLQWQSAAIVGVLSLTYVGSAYSDDASSASPIPTAAEPQATPAELAARAATAAARATEAAAAAAQAAAEAAAAESGVAQPNMIAVPTAATPAPSNPSDPAGCPSEDKINSDVQLAADGLKKLQARSSPRVAPNLVLPGYGEVVTELAAFVSNSAKLEARIWVQNEVLDDLCENQETGQFLPDVCSTTNGSQHGRVYKQQNLLVSTAAFNEEISSLRSDLKQLPACAFYKVVWKNATDRSDPQLSWVPYIGYYLMNGKVGNSTKEATLLSEIQKALPKLPSTVYPPGAQAVLNAVLTAADSARQKHYTDAIKVLLAEGQVQLCTADTDDAKTAACEALQTVVSLADKDDEPSLTEFLDSQTDIVGEMMRKKNHWIVSIDGIGGVQAGSQHLSGGGLSKSGTNYGLFVPIGIQSSWPLQNGYIAVLAAPIEAGSLATLSSKEATSQGTTSSTGSASIKRVISPGLYISYTFAGYDFAKDTPFTVGIGYNHSSDAATLNTTSGSSVNVGGSKIMLFFGWDITIFGI